MKKALNWLLNAAIIVIVGVAVAPLVLGVLFFILLFIASNTGMLDGLSRSEDAVAAMEATHLSAYTTHAPYYSATVDDSMTIFKLFKYDNHVDNTDSHAGIMIHTASADEWHTGALSPAEYAACIPVEAGFLLPDATFDAWFESAEDIAFFDQETGLFIRLRKGEAPKPGSVRTNKLTVPHNGYLYEMETHGGFHGDGSTYYALIVPENQRSALEKVLVAHADWHMGDVPHAEYRVLHDELFFQVLPLYPVADVDFEWCSFVDTHARMYPEEASPTTPDARFPAAMQEIGACWSMNWLCALYDPDTGLFIYYESDT